MRIFIKYDRSELEFQIIAEGPTEHALIDAIRAKAPPIEWTNETGIPAEAGFARFSLQIKPPAEKTRRDPKPAAPNLEPERELETRRDLLADRVAARRGGRA
jgi:hypothetical protein